MQTHSSPFVAQIQNIRNRIEQDGEAVIGAIELQALLKEHLGRNRWDIIAKIAIDENWSFTFFPDGSVRFARLAIE